MAKVNVNLWIIYTAMLSYSFIHLVILYPRSNSSLLYVCYKCLRILHPLSPLCSKVALAKNANESYLSENCESRSPDAVLSIFFPMVGFGANRKTKSSSNFVLFYLYYFFS